MTVEAIARTPVNTIVVDPWAERRWKRAPEPMPSSKVPELPQLARSKDYLDAVPAANIVRHRLGHDTSAQSYTAEIGKFPSAAPRR